MGAEVGSLEAERPMYFHFSAKTRTIPTTGNNVLSLLFSVGKEVQRVQAMPLSQGDLVLLVFPQVAESSTRCGQIPDWVRE